MASKLKLDGGALYARGRNARHGGALYARGKSGSATLYGGSLYGNGNQGSSYFAKATRGQPTSMVGGPSMKATESPAESTAPPAGPNPALGAAGREMQGCGRQKSGRGPSTSNWMMHVHTTKQHHPHLSLKEILRLASQSYRK